MFLILISPAHPEAVELICLFDPCFQNPHKLICGFQFTVGHSRQCDLWLKDPSVSKVLCKLLRIEVCAFWPNFRHCICKWMSGGATGGNGWFLYTKLTHYFSQILAREFICHQTRNRRRKRYRASKWKGPKQGFPSSDCNRRWWVDLFLCWDWEICLCILLE